MSTVQLRPASQLSLQSAQLQRKEEPAGALRETINNTSILETAGEDFVELIGLLAFWELVVPAISLAAGVSLVGRACLMQKLVRHPNCNERLPTCSHGLLLPSCRTRRVDGHRQQQLLSQPWRRCSVLVRAQQTEKDSTPSDDAPSSSSGTLSAAFNGN